MQDLFSCDWLLSGTVMSLKLICMVACDRFSFLLRVEPYSITFCLSIHPSMGIGLLLSLFKQNHGLYTSFCASKDRLIAITFTSYLGFYTYLAKQNFFMNNASFFFIEV